MGRWAAEEGMELENDISMANKDGGVEQKNQCVEKLENSQIFRVTILFEDV